MSVVSKKPLIKQQTIYNEEEKSKMSVSTKRVSFDSTRIQSDSDEENSLGRSNRRTEVKKPNGDDDDLLNMFRSERSDSDDDIVQTGSQIKKRNADKPNPVPRHLRSKSSTRDKRDVDLSQNESKTSVISENQLTDVLEQTINPKAKPRPQPRKMSGNIHCEEGSPRALKPEVTPRKLISDGTKAHEQGMDDVSRKVTMKSKYVLCGSGDDDGEDDVNVDRRRITNNKVSKEMNELNRESRIKKGFSNLKKEGYEQNGYDSDDRRNQDIVQLSSVSKEPDEGSFLLWKDNRVYSNSEARPFQGKSSFMKKDYKNSEEDIDPEKKYREMVPAPKPRKHPQDGIHQHIYKQEHNDDESNDDNKKTDGNGRKSMKNSPVPKARKEHLVRLQQQDIVPKSILSKSRLHPLDDMDDEDDDSNETHLELADKRTQIQHRDKEGHTEDEVDGRSKKEKTLDWSSLDESDDDNEAIGKKVNLFKKQRSTSAMTTKNYNDRGKSNVPKPSPRSKPHKVPENMEWQNGAPKERINYEDSTEYDFYQRGPGKRNNQAGPSIPPRRIPTPQRPGSSKRPSNSSRWGTVRDDEDITYMFEEHIPDKDALIAEDNQRLFKKDELKPRSSVTPKRGPMKADREIKEMTRSPHLRQTLTHTDYEEWDYLPQQPLGKQRTSSLTNLNGTGVSDNLKYYDEDNGPRRNSLDTDTIRQTVYDNWLSRKNITVKKELSKKALQKQREEEKRKEEEDRKKHVQLAFQSWNKHKAEMLKEQHAKMKAKQKEEQEKTELEKRMKEKDSKKYFESWKSKKDGLLKETYKEKKKDFNLKKKKEMEEKLEKTTSSKKSFENWKSKKDTILKQQVKEKRKKEKLQDSKKEEESYEKTIKNADEFQKWVENKGKPRKAPPPPTLTQRAWVPGGRDTRDCIPASVQPVILPPSSNRARTMSGTYRGKTKYYDF